MGDRISSTASSSVKDNDSPMRKALFNTSSLIGHQWENRERWGDRCCRWKTDWNQLLLSPWDCQLLVIQPGYLGTAPSTDHLWRPLNLLPYYSSHTPRANLPLHRGLRADWQTCDTPPPPLNKRAPCSSEQVKYSLALRAAHLLSRSLPGKVTQDLFTLEMPL